MQAASPLLVTGPSSARKEARLPGPLFDRIVATTAAVHAAGLKSSGLLLADPLAPGFPFTASDVLFFDPRRSRRTGPALQPACEAQGTYFRSYDDAGFVADPAALLQVHRRPEATDLVAVAPFHVHRRQPANFSVVDFRLHNPAFAWHLIVSLREPDHPDLRPFAVDKDVSAEFGISALERNEGGERPYAGPEVSALRLTVDRTYGG
jgi:hypothetical protein